MKTEKYIDGLYGVKSDINLVRLRKTCNEMYDIIKCSFKSDNSDYKGNSTLTTQLFSKYNLLMYPFPILHDLYFEISKAFHYCAEDFYGKKVDSKYYIQCWLNYYKKGEYIDWHVHNPPEHSAWHGFLCVDTEPNSQTSYRWPNDPNRKGLEINVPSRDGKIVMGTSNDDRHRSSEWKIEDRPRITIAFDIVPAISLSDFQIRDYPEPKYLNAMKRSAYFVNHWIPI